MLNRRLRRVIRACPVVLAACLTLGVPVLVAQGSSQPTVTTGMPGFSESDAREWLTYLSSDTLQGREVFTEGYGMAAAYVAEHLRQWGLKPLGDNGTYLQTVSLNGYRVTRRSSLAIRVGGKARTFVHGADVDFPLGSGGKQTLTFDGAVVVTDRPTLPDHTARDVADRSDLRGKLVLYLPGGSGPSLRREEAGDDLDLPTRMVRRAGAAAVVTFVPTPPPRKAATAAPSRGDGLRVQTPDITTVERLDRLVPPSVTAGESLFEFLFSGAAEPFSVWRTRATRRESMPAQALSGVSIAITIDNTFDVVSTQLTANVVGMVEGSDPALRQTFVFIGAHLDHVGYARGSEAKGRVVSPLHEDRIWNGADDNGSGSVGLMGIARAMASGAKPRRSVVFVWHAGEETGLLGSRYMVDTPVVPLDRVQAVFNLDMIGRDRDDRRSERDTLYVIGADRISTDLHNIVVRTNDAAPAPMTLDFEYNDPADVQSFYTRSDHYTYAQRGIPIAFFFTGTHDDYHANSDTVDKIIFSKLVRVAELIYRIGFSVADSPEALNRDNRGPRSGRGFSGTLGAPSQ
jgi:hypothetical protein